MTLQWTWFVAPFCQNTQLFSSFDLVFLFLNCPHTTPNMSSDIEMIWLSRIRESESLWSPYRYRNCAAGFYTRGPQPHTILKAQAWWLGGNKTIISCSMVMPRKRVVSSSLSEIGHFFFFFPLKKKNVGDLSTTRRGSSLNCLIRKPPFRAPIVFHRGRLSHQSGYHPLSHRFVGC